MWLARTAFFRKVITALGNPSPTMTSPSPLSDFLDNSWIMKTRYSLLWSCSGSKMWGKRDTAYFTIFQVTLRIPKASTGIHRLPESDFPQSLLQQICKSGALVSVTETSTWSRGHSEPAQSFCFQEWVVTQH